jgi:hypothetical protein
VSLRDLLPREERTLAEASMANKSAFIAIAIAIPIKVSDQVIRNLRCSLAAILFTTSRVGEASRY